MSPYQPPELLAARHQLTGFRCRSVEQTAWLVEVARQAHGAGTTRVFVVTELAQPQVVAYYAWCMASVAIADRPEQPGGGCANSVQAVFPLTAPVHPQEKGRRRSPSWSAS